MTVLIDPAEVRCNNHLQHLGPILLEERRRIHMKVAPQKAGRNLPLAHDWMVPQEHRQGVRTRCFHDVALAVLGQNTGYEKAENMHRSHSQMYADREGWVAEVVQGIAGPPMVQIAAGMMLGNQRSEVALIDPILQSPQGRYDHPPRAAFRTLRRHASSS